MQNSKTSSLIRNLRRAAFFLFLFGLAISSGVAANAQTLVLTGGNVIKSPDAAPLADAVVLTSNGVITAIGSRGELQIPADARVIDCTGKTVVAGFWNSHVHFTQAVWTNADNGPAASLQQHMQEMLTQWGFTTVWDLGSDPGNSLPLRARVNSGEVAGPNILLAGNMYPKGGHPVYLPAEIQLPEVATPDEAAELARDYMRMDLDGIKLFVGASMGEKPTVNMDPAIAKAAVDVAHAQGKPVFAHPQNRVGVDVVIAAGVNVLAHTVPREAGYTQEELAAFKSQGIALIPTLSLFAKAPLGAALAERALGESQVLASLTTNPAHYFKAAKKGQVEQGFDADLVVLDGDPMADVRNLARIAYTIRAGKVIYQKP
jgi:imidazolonepropionase-like amidohydrolase